MPDAKFHSAVTKCVEDFAQTLEPAEKILLPLVRRTRTIPLLIQEGGFVGLREDGQFVWVSDSGFVEGDLDDLTINRARIRGAQRYEPLAFLLPQRDATCIVCPGCSGSGACEFGHSYNYGAGLKCQCGGLGWLREEWVSFPLDPDDAPPEPKNAVDRHSDIRGSLYEALLRFGAGRGHSASLVVRADQIISREARAAFDLLAPLAASREKVTRWPSTIVMRPEPMATLIRFPLTIPALDTLLSHARSVFDWQQPWLPQDLTLYDQNGRDWFVTIAHEAEWFVDTKKIDAEALRSSIPQLRF